MKKSINYFGWKANTKPLVKNQSPKSKRLNFMNSSVKKSKFSTPKLFQPTRMKQSNPMFRKDSLDSRKLKPYGDVDLDGSPNKFDCSPRQVNKDGLLGNVWKKVPGRRDSEPRVARVSPQEIQRRYVDSRRELREKDVLEEAREGMRLERQKAMQSKAKQIASRLRRVTKPLTKPETTGLKLASAILPRGTIPRRAYATSEKKESNVRYGRPGRPRGALSGGYYIPGKGAVDVREWRKWTAKQRKLKRMMTPQQASEQYAKSQSYQESYPQEVPSETEGYQPTLQMEQERIRQMQIERMQQVQSPYQENQLTREPGVRLATEQSQNILNAPNIMRGEMTKVVSGINEKPIINLPQRPVTNPNGSEFIEIDPASGRPMVRRRITEKWMSGEAL
jgi:hypothetical protein